MKQLDREYRTDPQKTKLMNKAALELNITTATFNCKYCRSKCERGEYITKQLYVF